MLPCPPRISSVSRNNSCNLNETLLIGDNIGRFYDIVLGLNIKFVSPINLFSFFLILKRILEWLVLLKVCG